MVAYVLRRAALASGVLLLVSYATFVFVATQFSATCASEYTPTGAFPPLADGVGHASTLYLRWLKGIPSGDSFGSVCGGTVTQNLGPARGSGVMVRSGRHWLIEQYVLSVVVPNDKFKAVKELLDR